MGVVHIQGNRQNKRLWQALLSRNLLVIFICSTGQRLCAGPYTEIWSWTCGLDPTFPQSRFSKVARDTLKHKFSNFLLSAVMCRILPIRDISSRVSFSWNASLSSAFYCRNIKELEHLLESLPVPISVTVGANIPECEQDSIKHTLLAHVPLFHYNSICFSGQLKWKLCIGGVLKPINPLPSASGW